MSSNFGSSSIGEKKRIIIKNPDGTYMHCYKSGERDSTYSSKDKKNNEIEADNLSIDDSELDYIVRNYEQFDNGNIIEDFLNIFKKNLVIYITFLTSELILSSFLTYQAYINRKVIITTVLSCYDLKYETVETMFKILFFSGIASNIIYYPFGYYSILSNKYKLLQIFSTFSLVTGIVTIFFIYFNLLYLLLMIMRLVLFTFSKFMASLLVSIIVLPRRMQINQYDTIDTNDNTN